MAKRCRCKGKVINGDCPMSFANGAHERGETHGKTLAEFLGETPKMPAVRTRPKRSK